MANVTQRVLAGVGWVLVVKIFGLGTALIVNALLARMLNPELFGTYILISSITMSGASIASYGMKQATVKMVAEAGRKPGAPSARESVNAAMKIVMFGVLLVGAVYWLGLGDWLAVHIFENVGVQDNTAIVVMWFALLAIQVPIVEGFRGTGDVRSAAILDTVSANLIVAVGLAGIWVFTAELTVSLVLLLFTLATGAGVAIGAFFLLEKLGKSDPHEPRISLGMLSRFSRPFFVTNVATLITNYSSIWIVGALLGATDVAVYGAAWKLVQLVGIPLMLVNMSIQPLIVEFAIKPQSQSLQNTLRGSATLAGIPAMFVILCLVTMSDRVMGWIYGATYYGHGLPLAILAIGQLVSTWTGSCGQVLALTGHQRQLMLVTVSSGVLAVVATYLGALHWGTVGAAMGVSIGRIVQNMTTWILAYRLERVWTHATIHPQFLLLGLSKIRALTKKRGDR